ncbi:bifunctional helix-turn-helix transcriptional regulator/GNAT family N-acetyltransferase [Allosphingosinicella deserti]|nr:helix-turn-helix domain-containing GNAT family N-acetyltransferase [Sphingomonas deserti]
MLNAIGRGRSDLADLRSYLGLDSGLASRLLRELEGEGLVATRPDAADGRRRVIRLTEAGCREFDAYERLSNSRAEVVLARSPNAPALLAAMDLVANTLASDRLCIDEVHPQSSEALYCLREYYAELDRRFEGGFEVARSRDPDSGDMVAPRGTFLVAMIDDLPLGCVGLKRTGESCAEVKRLWVSGSARGLGIARELMVSVEEAALSFGVRKLVLDTNRALEEALAMYRAWGWREIARFNDDPYADFFFEKMLAG